MSYASKRQQFIPLSSCEAEIMAASVAATGTVYVREILRDLGLPQLQPTTLGVDNKVPFSWPRSARSRIRAGTSPVGI